MMLIKNICSFLTSFLIDFDNSRKSIFYIMGSIFGTVRAQVNFVHIKLFQEKNNSFSMSK